MSDSTNPMLSRRGVLRGGAAAGLSLGLGGVLAACGAEPGNGGGSGGAPVTISYTYWVATMVETIDRLTAEFHEQHPNITIDAQLTPPAQYWTKLQTAVTGQNAPDVAMMNGPNSGLYASNDTLLRLDDLIAGDQVDLSAYADAAVDLYRIDGGVYGLPINVATTALFYNKTMFADAGLAAPDETWTWDTLRDAAATLTDSDKGIFGFASPLGNQSGYYCTIPQAGGFVIDEDRTRSGFDDPKSIDGIQYLLDFVTEGHSPSHEQSLSTVVSDMFISGKVAMMHHIPAGAWQCWGSEQIRPHTDIAPLPAGPAGPATTVHSTANCVMSQSEHPEEAWEWVKFLASREAQEQFGADGAIIPAYQGAESAFLASMPDFNVKAFIDQYEHGVPYPSSQNTAVWQKLETEHLAPVWAGEAELEPSAAALAAAMNEALEAE